jgi:glutamyl-tRNA synthetase
MKKGFRTFREVDEASRFLFVADQEIQFDPAAIEKVLRKGGGAGFNALRDIRGVLQNLGTWQAHGIEEAVKQYCEQKQLGLGNVAQPIRVAISGTTVSPPIFQSLEFIGKEPTMRRIDRCIQATGETPVPH